MFSSRRLLSRFAFSAFCGSSICIFFIGYCSQTYATAIRDSSYNEAEDNSYIDEAGNGIQSDDDQQPITAANLYGLSPNTNSSNGKGEVLYFLNFARQFQSEFNPRNPNSKWQWANSGLGLLFPTDNGWFKIVSNGNDKYAQISDEEYGSLSKKRNEYGSSYLELTSRPFAEEGYNEAYLVPKFNHSVSDTQRVLGRIKTSCHTTDVVPNPYPPEFVVDAQGDPRLSSCVFEMCNVDNNFFPAFFFLITNKNIWGGYTGTNFRAKKFLASRARYDEVAELGIELDGRLQVANYYIDGKKVWTINNLGLPPPVDSTTRVDVGTITSSKPNVTNISTVLYSMGTAKCLDETDPNNATSTIRLVRVSPSDSLFYSPTTLFFDPNKTRSNEDYGQGASINLYKLIVVRAKSVPETESASNYNNLQAADVLEDFKRY